MKIYKIYQDINCGWDTFDSAIVIAENEEQARKIHPRIDPENWKNTFSGWASDPINVGVIYIGEASPDIKDIVICASFNAG